MFLIKSNETNNPKTNLAIEEFAVRQLNDKNDFLYIYQNKPSVIIGKNQNPFEEINLPFILKEDIEIMRRISGGGAVYHEPGNINFCYITKSTRDNFNNYKNFLQPIVDYLKRLDVPAKINDRNDLVIQGKKISGNAQFTSRDKMLSHGTLLFNADLDVLAKSLEPGKLNLRSKSTKSVKSVVTNISEHLKNKLSIEEFKTGLIKSLLNENKFEGEIEFDQSQWAEINDLVNKKYNSWDWIWGRTPVFNIKVSFGWQDKYHSFFEIKGGIIHSVSGKENHRYKEIFDSLTGTKYWKSNIEATLKDNWPTLDEANKKLMADCIFPF